jgi:hypothetical protein
MRIKLTDEELKLNRKETKRRWYLKHKNDVIEYQKQYRENNLSKRSEYEKEYRDKNKKEILIKQKKYRINNIKKMRESEKQSRIKNSHKRNLYNKNRRQIDPLYKLKCNTRTLIYKAIITNNYIKKSKTTNILGCSIEDFKLYLESKFEAWMNWDNYGKYNGQPNYGWDIDHIIPSSSANTEEELIKLNHYTNLQPLCSYINRNVKSNNIII